MKAQRAADINPEGPVRLNASRIIRLRLEELRSFAPAALDPHGETAQHDMRIAAKRLRYILEIFGRCFGEQAEAARRAAKSLQGVLGELHDCDVLLPRAAGIPSLEALLRRRRELLFQRFRDLWHAESDAGTWTALDLSAFSEIGPVKDS
jgi:CHAD domain-containing protein